MKTRKLLSQALCLAALLGAAVSCDNETQPYLTVEEGLELQFGFDENAEKSIVIKSNISWTVEKPGECDWVTLSAAKGENNGSVKVTVAENPELEGRSAFLTVSPSDSGIKSIEIKVFQAEGVLTPLSVDNTDISFNSAGSGSGTFKVSYKQSWKITLPEGAAEWLTLSATEGAGNAEIVVLANDNPLSTQREAILSVAPADGAFGPVEVTVTQDGNLNFNVLTAIPDMKFRTFCMRFDEDNNGILSVAEAAAVEQMVLDNLQIASLKGIEYFTGLKTLACIKNTLSELDLSYNTKLIALDCSENNLTRLNVSACADLEYLYAGNNQLRTVDISQNTKLTLLSLQYNDMEGVNIEKNTKLTSLYLAGCNLTSIDVSNNPALVNLYFSGNQFLELDFSVLPKLQRIYLDNSFLTELNVSQNPDLRVLIVSGNDIASIDVSNNPLLTDLWVNYNPLTALNVSNNPLITSFQCIGTLVSMLDLSTCPGMVQILCNDNENLTELDISTCTGLQSLSCHNCPKLTTVWVWPTFAEPMLWPMPWTYPNGVIWGQR